MKTRTKALLLSLCAMMLVAASIFGTMAYLTAQDTVTNTFTVGNVAITLDEAKVNPDGSVVVVSDGQNGYKPAPRVRANTYKLIPGHTYTKDPTIHVATGSENCFLFIKVENGISTLEDSSKTILSQMTSSTYGWKALGTNYPNIYYYVGNGANNPTNAVAVAADNDIKIFDSFTISGTADLSTVNQNNTTTTITITAYAVQADGFNPETPAAIWAATFGATSTPAGGAE